MFSKPSLLALIAFIVSVVSLYAANKETAGSVNDEKFIGARRGYWAFQKPLRPEVPALGSPWISTPIDAFLLEALGNKKLAPSVPLDREHMLRRVTLDLIGLPPTPGEIDLFLKDHSADAYQKVVDRLLTSPYYGERWAQRWLDVVRYADTNGYELDADRPHAWRYRDYVVRSFNDDKPFNRFVQEQIAGDEIWPGNHDALIATGFHRAGPLHLVGGNQDEEMNRQEVLTEMSGAIGSVFLGLTIGCARCHNHKFDPILQADYYRMQAIFAATEGKDIEIATSEEKEAYKKANDEFKARSAPVLKQISDIEKPFRDKLSAEKKAQLEPKLREALDTPDETRTPEQKILAKDAKEQIGSKWDEILALMPQAERDKRTALRKQLHEIELTRPDPPATAYAVSDLEKAPATYILKVGDYKNKMGAVDAGLPVVLRRPYGDFPQEPVKRRSTLANWIASVDHPLTARVMVNRIWQFRMGTGIVGTPNDFGTLGQRPTNQKLLDYLATEFMANNWSVKAIDRSIVLSSAYRQSAATDPAKAKIDPDNKLYWRANRRRLEGEAIRDQILAATGSLHLKLGGKPVRVPIEPEVYALIFSEDEPDNLWPLPPDPKEYNRRSLYLLNKRTVRLPMLMNFDQPDAMTSCPVRPTSTHALQALSLMNSDFMAQQSKLFAARLESECGRNRQCQLRHAYKLAMARSPLPVEIRIAEKFRAKGGQLQDFCLALLNRNEFVYIP